MQVTQLHLFISATCIYIHTPKWFWGKALYMAFIILLFVLKGHSTSTANKPVRKTKPVTIKPQVDPETGTVSGKYTLREEYKPKPVTAQLPEVEEQECTTDPYCGIRIM